MHVQFNMVAKCNECYKWLFIILFSEAKEDKKDEEAKEETSEVWVQVQAGFEVGEIGVDLYTGKVHLVSLESLNP